MKTLGGRIREVRESLSMTLGEFGSTLHISEKIIDIWERGIEDIGPSFIAHLCVKHRVCANWLLLGVGEMRPSEKHDGQDTQDSSGDVSDDSILLTLSISIPADVALDTLTNKIKSILSEKDIEKDKTAEDIEDTREDAERVR